MAEKTEKPSHLVAHKAHAPRSADDWEVLFEDPENGLIAMIEQAHSLDALEQSTSLALTKLLVHEEERALRAALVGQRMQLGEASQPRRVFVDLGIVLHGA